MNRTLSIRNITLLAVFTVIVVASPLLFAQVTSPTLIRVDQSQLPLYNESNQNIVNTRLAEGSVIRLPNPVLENIVYDENGEVAMAETLLVWHTLAADNKKLLPRMVGGKLAYPVKVLLASDSGFDVESREALGYVTLGQLTKPNAFNTVRAAADAIPIVVPKKDSEASALLDEVTQTTLDEAITEQAEEGVVDIETTSPESSLRPVIRPETMARPLTAAPSANSQFVCENNYSRNYARTNCFTQKGMTLVEKAEHIMGDLEAVNQLRGPRSPIDPRFSLCIARRESNLAPNADSGRGDWGLFQIRDTTGEDVLKNYGMVTPGFQQYDKKNEYRALKRAMVKSPMAQADLHQSVVIEKARIIDFVKGTNIRQRLGNGSMRVQDYQMLADYYNASSARRAYSRAIASCYRAMLSVADEYGRIRSGQKGNLKAALDKATH